MQDILTQLLNAADAGRPVVFTALVETRGSTPQKAGAAMLLEADGTQVGTLGGGCVEAEVKRRALQLLNPDGGRELMTFLLDNDYGWDDGLICGGRMTMLVEPLRSGADLSFFRSVHSALDSAKGCTLAVTLDDGERPKLTLFDGDGQLVVQSGPAASPPDTRHVPSGGFNTSSGVAGAGPTGSPGPANAGVSPKAPTPATLPMQGVEASPPVPKPLSDRPRPYVADGVSYLPQLPRCRLVIVGGGHVGEKVAELAAAVDFDVWVIDDREAYCNVGRFPQAQRLIVGPIDDVLPGLEVDPSTFCIIVTRGHNHDEQALFHLAETPARYVGMIGSKRKIKLIFDDLRREGISDEALARVHAPLGLDIGSQTVPEIAVSIVAQLIAERNLGPSVQRESH